MSLTEQKENILELLLLELVAKSRMMEEAIKSIWLSYMRNQGAPHSLPMTQIEKDNLKDLAKKLLELVEELV